MKHTLRLLLCASLAFHFPLSTFHLTAQPLPQGYFRNPMDHEIGLSATFAELRTGHFHAGLDMRTGGATGKPVYAAADGYVAKVSISPWGGGKILYIKHPNGYTTVYMHLDSYAGAIGKAVLKEQYAQRSYSISKLFAPDELPVKQGQLVARSGNTGGSGGPHLHFEVRRGGAADLHTHATIFNPLHCGLPYKDNINPTIRGVRLYPENGEPYEVPADGNVTVSGPFHLGVYATDAAEGSTAKNGVDRMEVLLDGTPFFLYTTESIPVDSSRMVNALVDYPHMAHTRQAYLLTRGLPGAEGPWVPLRMGDGIFRLKAGSTHSIGIRVYDIKDNVAERTLTVKVTEIGNRKTEPVTDGVAVKYDQPFSFQQSMFSLQLPAHTLYADDRMVCTGNGMTVTVNPSLNMIPPHLSYTLSIKGSLPGVPADKTVVVHVTRKPGSTKLSAYKTTHADGLHTALVRDWGEFTLAADTTAPVVRPVNFSEGKPLKTTTLKVRIGDNLAGIDTYHCYLNGQWILAEYDGKTATLVIDARGKLKAGPNNLRTVVTDGAGNVKDLTWVLTR
ncbi:MAG: M23 family metallopeptidase [Bacteroidales bacterium]|nr:M23 family metallopeptidase [Bacteroidales bacterium]